MGNYSMATHSGSWDNPRHPYHQQAQKSRSEEFSTGAGTCDYCGEKGHDYTIHPQAVADVQQWQKQRHAEEFPFGDHHEDY